ncbi:unnamed protein product [Camellia sinensis]
MIPDKQTVQGRRHIMLYSVTTIIVDWKMVPGLKTGRLRKKTLMQPETDSPAAIPLGSPIAPSRVLPIRSNVGPSHHATSQLMVDSDETQAPSETQPSGVGTSKPLRVRRPTLGKGIQKIIRAKKGEKCHVHIDRGLNAMTGKYATPATNELGIQIRTLCPVKDVKSWLDLDETTKVAIIQAVLDKFQIGDDFHNDIQEQEIVNKKAYGLYKDWRYTLKQEFELLEELPRDEIYAHPPVGMSLDDWKHLIDVAWQDASHQKRSKAGKSNRSQLSYNHTNGSRSFPIAMAAMVAKNRELDFPKFYEDSHTSKKTNDWIHPKCRELHHGMVNVQTAAIESGTPLTQEELSRLVLGQKKRYLLGFGSGPQPSTIFASRAHNKDIEAMRAEVEALCEERQKYHDELMKEREERERCYNELLKEREEHIQLSNEMLKEREEGQKAREETSTKVEHLNNVVTKLGYLAARPELDLVEQEDQLTHEISFLENEKRYEEVKNTILSEESEDDADADSDAGSDDEDDEESDEELYVKIDQEREGEQIDRALLKNVLDIFVEIGMGQMDHYETDFEADMLKDTAAYYSRKASNWILEDSCPDYMLKAEECLKREKDRVAHYLHSSSELKLLEKVQHELLSVYATQLLEKEHSGCHALLRDDKVEDLSRMYRLFSKIPRGLDPISSIFKQHVTAEGTALVKQAEDAASNKKADKKDVVGLQEQVMSNSYSTSLLGFVNGFLVWELTNLWGLQVFVRKVIELHDKYMAYVNNCFMNHTLFHKALKEAFEVFCNKGVGGSSSAELLATFCDNILKKGGSEKLTDEAIEETLEKVVKLLAYISDKDLFAEFYRKKLARRLLFDKSANDEHERSILTNLKQQCGGQFTSKMEGMVTDLTLARENRTNFEEYLKTNPNASPGIDLTVTVLTTVFWPSYKSFDLNLPAEMVKCVEVFREFYQTKTKHRKLTWIYSLGTCNLNGKFEPKTMELIVTTYQASALLLFNASDRLSYQEILTQLNLTDDDVVRLLHSLSCAKYKILNKEPNTKTISPTDHFEFNSKFTDKMRRIKIPLPPVDEKKKVIEDVDKDRRYAIDASIVRIMKSRKVLGHQQLVMECVEQLGRMFKPDFKAIKKRIEDLITRDYLERDKDNPNLFSTKS